MTNSYLRKIIDMWKVRALKAEIRVKYLEKILEENNVSFEPNSS